MAGNFMLPAFFDLSTVFASFYAKINESISQTRWITWIKQREK